MAKKRSYRRRKKNNPQFEIIFISILLLCAIVMPFARQYEQLLNLATLGLVLLAAVLATGLYVAIRRNVQKQQKALKAVEISEVDTMTGVEFEQYVAHLLRAQGYKITETPRSGDFGVDLLASKNGERTAVQLKRYSKKVNLEAVQQVVAGMAYKNYKAHKSMVVTNNSFTLSAHVLAATHNCELVDREKLGEWIVEFQNTS